MDDKIGDRIKELRKSRKITQEKLAERCNLSRSKVSSWETNKREMTITDMIKIASIFEMSIDNILNIGPISTGEYIEISQKFFRSSKISLKEKINIIRILEEGIKKDNIDELYKNYIMTQYETK